MTPCGRELRPEVPGGARCGDPGHGLCAGCERGVEAEFALTECARDSFLAVAVRWLSRATGVLRRDGA